MPRGVIPKKRYAATYSGKFPNLTQDILKTRVVYDPNSGNFSRAKTKRSVKHGKIMGWTDDLGYIHVRVLDKLYLAHRLAWLYMTGAWPEGYLDHKDGNPSNNSILNLRECTQQENCFNSKIIHKKSSVRKGVCWHEQKQKYRAYIKANGKWTHLGYFNDMNDAIAARISAEEKYHGEFRRAA